MRTRAVIDGVIPDGDAATAGPADPAGNDGPPMLSVIIACLNAATTLGTQLDALARQSSPVPWELLICDNGSTDATVAVALRYQDRIPGLRVVDASGVRGAGAARNQGAEEARGEWLAFCDAD